MDVPRDVPRENEEFRFRSTVIHGMIAFNIGVIFDVDREQYVSKDAAERKRRSCVSKIQVISEAPKLKSDGTKTSGSLYAFVGDWSDDTNGNPPGRLRVVMNWIQYIMSDPERGPYELIAWEVLACREIALNTNQDITNIIRRNQGTFDVRRLAVLKFKKEPVFALNSQGQLRCQVVIEIINDLEALELHDEARIVEIAAGRKVNVTKYDGVWFYTDLASFFNRNLGLRKKGNELDLDTYQFIVTKAAGWFFNPETVRKIRAVSKAYLDALKRSREIRAPAGAPAAIPVISSGQGPNIIAPEPIGAPRLEAEPSHENEDELSKMADNTIQRIANIFQTKLCRTPKQHIDLLRKIQTAADPRSSESGGKSVFNLCSGHLIKDKNANQSKNMIFGVVSGASLFGDNRAVLVAIDADEKKGYIDWADPENVQTSRSRNNLKLVYFIVQRVMQKLFDQIIDENFSNDADQFKANYSSGGSGGSGSMGQIPSQQVPENATFEDKMRMLADFLVSESEVGQQSAFAVVYNPDEDIGFPPSIISIVDIQYRGNLSQAGAPSLPNIPSQPRSLVAEVVMDLGDSSSRIIAYENAIREFREVMPSVPSVISQVRSSQDNPLQVEPIHIEPSGEAFVLARPNVVQGVQMVDVRVPAPPAGELQFSPQSLGEMEAIEDEEEAE
jgi:hypothetical protein